MRHESPNCANHRPTSGTLCIAKGRSPTNSYALPIGPNLPVMCPDYIVRVLESCRNVPLQRSHLSSRKMSKSFQFSYLLSLFAFLSLWPTGWRDGLVPSGRDIW